VLQSWVVEVCLQPPPVGSFEVLDDPAQFLTWSDAESETDSRR